MSRTTGIEWTDATWNPIRGCSRVSEGCRNCYAETVANRFCGPGSPYEGVVQIGADGKGNGKWNGQIKFVEKHLLDPLKWKKPQRIFVNSMSDLFHENVTDEMRDKIFAVMALCPQHTFQVLTKRPERMLDYASGETRFAQIAAFADAFAAKMGWDEWIPQWPLPNVWLGVSVENQKAADERISLLLQTLAAVRFISAEPLLGPVNVDPWFIDRDFQCSGFIPAERADNPYCQCGGHESDPCHHSPAGLLDWVIVGGESGPGARPMHPEWARSLRDQCIAAGVPFFFKQWGEWLPWEFDGGYAELKSQAGKLMDRHGLPDEDAEAERRGWKFSELFDQDGEIVGWQRVGKKAAGHLLDGAEWHQMPERAS